jgi:hypothetical protein
MIAMIAPSVPGCFELIVSSCDTFLGAFRRGPASTRGLWDLDTQSVLPKHRSQQEIPLFT